MLAFACLASSILASSIPAVVSVDPGWPAVPMARSASRAGGPVWEVYPDTFVTAGGELTNHSATVAEAETWCAAHVSCLGFSYNTAVPAALPATPGGAGGSPGHGARYNMHFNAVVARQAGKGWAAVVRSIPRVLSATFTASMVLQHDQPCLWGWGNNHTGAEVAVATDGDGGVVGKTKVKADNSWRLCLPAIKPGGPWTVNVSVAGFAAVSLPDVLFGEVWVASGQSNMAFTVAQAFNATAECAAASGFPNLRVMSVAQRGSDTPNRDLDSVRLPWARASAQSLCGGDFDVTSAVGYFFARDLHLALGTATMPVGLIVSSVPGTAIEMWSPPQVLTACNDTKKSSTLWNNMISPLLEVSIRGVIWYQGEANEADESYACTFPGMITAWRHHWTAAAPSPGGLGFPFLFVQLAPYMSETPISCLLEGGPGLPEYKGMLPRARLRQLEALKLGNVGMATAVDLADSASPFWPGSVHPRHKQPIGHRLSLEARRIAYGETALLSRGPQLESVIAFRACDLEFSCGGYHEKDPFLLRLAFTSTGDGLEVSTFAATAFVLGFGDATHGNGCRVPCGIVPTGVTATTLDIYCTTEQYCKPPKGSGGVFPHGSLDALFFDVPVVPVFNSARLPLEPFSVNVTTNNATLPKTGMRLWP